VHNVSKSETQEFRWGVKDARKLGYGVCDEKSERKRYSEWPEEGCSNFKVVGVLVHGAAVRPWTRDRKVAGSTPGRGAIMSTRSNQPSIPPG